MLKNIYKWDVTHLKIDFKQFKKATYYFTEDMS